MERLLDKLLSIPEAAGVLSCSDAAIRKWINQRRIRITKVGSLTRLRACDVDTIAKDGLPAKGAHPRTSGDH